MRAQDGERGAHLVGGVGRESAHRQLQTLGFERAGTQRLERLRHAAELVGALGRGYRFIEFTAAQAGDGADQDLHRTGQPALYMHDGKTPKATTDVRSRPATSSVRNAEARIASA